MKFKDNLIRLRKERSWSQEELGFRLDVSRQTISKWESGDTTPEMGRLMKLSELFEVSLDELVKGKNSEVKSSPIQFRYRNEYEYVSKREFYGYPLIHVNIGKGFKQAKGVIAIGNIAVGIVAIGGISIGMISIGLLSFGLIVLAALSIGILSMGALSIGILSIGAIATGYIAIGGVARGIYAIGGVSIARDIAIGGYASGYIAVGESVKGVITFMSENNFTDIDIREVLQTIETVFPDLNRVVSSLIEGLLL